MDACILIGTPSYDGRVHVCYMASVMGSVAHLDARGVRCATQILSSSVLPGTRNLLVQRALEGGYTHLLFADSDMGWPADAPLRLLRWGEDAVGGAYLGRQSRAFSLFNPRPAAAGGPPLEVDAVGTGFLLLSRACLERVWRAYPGRPFEFAHGPDPSSVQGEDITFCLRWRGLGGRVFVDPTFRMAHVAAVELDWTWHEALAEGGAPCGSGQCVTPADLVPQENAAGRGARDARPPRAAEAGGAGR